MFKICVSFVCICLNIHNLAKVFMIRVVVYLVDAVFCITYAFTCKYCSLNPIVLPMVLSFAQIGLNALLFSKISGYRYKQVK